MLPDPSKAGKGVADTTNDVRGYQTAGMDGASRIQTAGRTPLGLEASCKVSPAKQDTADLQKQLRSYSRFCIPQNSKHILNTLEIGGRIVNAVQAGIQDTPATATNPL